MKSLRMLALATMVLAAAGPALAADQIYHKADGPVILDTFDGKPIWELQAVCAGFHGATANYYQRHGDTAAARASEAAGVMAFDEAVAKIRRDRDLSEADAAKVATPVVTHGGRSFAQALRRQGMDDQSRWNYWRSFCGDAQDTFRRISH
jgi:hypothetical protein